MNPSKKGNWKKYLPYVTMIIIIVVVLILFFTGRIFGEDEVDGGGDKGSSNVDVSTSEIPLPTSVPSGNDSSPDSDSEERSTEEKESNRDPLPGENVAVLENPDGDTVYDRFKPNTEKIGDEVEVAYWGGAFYPPVARSGGEEVNPGLQAIDPPRISESSRRNNEVDSFLSRMVQEILNYKTRDYANLSCSISGLGRGSDEISEHLLMKHDERCSFEHTPTGAWSSLMDKNASTKVTEMKILQQGNSYVFKDSDDSGSRTYIVSTKLVDSSGKKVFDAEPKMMVSVKASKNSEGSWRVIDFEASVME